MKKVLEWAKVAVQDLDRQEEGVEFLSLLNQADRLGK